MAIEIRPTVSQDPVKSQTGGISASVAPMRDASAGSLLAVGGGMQDLGRAVTVAADRFQDKVDIAQSQRMRNLYDVEVENELLAPDRGFLTTEGMDANKDRRKQSFDRLREKRKSIEALGQNDVQRVNFAEHADRADAESNLRADVHQDREVKHFLAGETKTSAALGIRRGIKLVGTDEGDLAVAGAMRDLDKLGDLYGWPKDSKLRQDMKQDATDLLHTGVISEMLADNNSSAASAYLKQHGAKMSDDKATAAKRLVAKGEVDDTSTKLAKAITYEHSKAGTPPEPPVVGVEVLPRKPQEPVPSSEPLRSFARRVTDKLFADHRIDAKVRDATIERIKAQENERQDIEAQQNIATMTAAEKWVADNPGKNPRLMGTLLYNAVERAGKLPELQSFARSQHPTSDEQSYAEARTLMENPAMLRAVSAPVLTHHFWGRLSDGDRDALMSAHAIAIGKATDKDHFTKEQEDRIVEGFFRATGEARVPVNKLSDQRKAQLFVYRDAVLERLKVAKPDTDLQEIIDGVNQDRVSLKQSFLGLDFLWGDKQVRSDMGYDPLHPAARGGVPTVLLTDDEKKRANVNVGGKQVFIGEVPGQPVHSETVNDTVADQEGTSVHQEILKQLRDAGVPAHRWTEAWITTLWVQAGRPKTVAEVRSDLPRQIATMPGDAYGPNPVDREAIDRRARLYQRILDYGAGGKR